MDYHTTLIEVPRPSDANQLRKAIVANAYSLVGVSASDKITRPIFENILGPTTGVWDLSRPFKATQINGKWVTQGVSTCGLVARGLWRRMNVDMDALYHNYIFGSAISGDRSFGIKNKAWQETWTGPARDLRPQPGDYCIIGSGLSTHALTVVDYLNEKIVSVDGGQVDSHGLQCIKRVERTWEQKGDENKVSPYLGGRKVVGWIVFDMLPFKGTTMLVPDGWENITLSI